MRQDFRKWDERVDCPECGASVKVKWGGLGFWDREYSHVIDGYRCKQRQAKHYPPGVVRGTRASRSPRGWTDLEKEVERRR